jgi:signal transduction histidine kinase
VKRLAIFALIGIAVPAAILTVLGYVSLRQWETSSELLFKEQARDLAAMAADKIEMMLKHTDDDVLAHLQRVIASPDLDQRTLDELLASLPLVRRLYLFNLRSELLYPKHRHLEDAAVLARLRSEAAQGSWEKGGRRDLVVGEHLVLATVCNLHDGTPVLTAVSRDPDVLRREVFDRTVRALESPTIVAVVDHLDRPVYSGGTLDRADRIATARFRETLPDWRVAIYQPQGTSPRESVRRQIALFTAAFGLLIVVIVAGIVTTYRLMRRETEMSRLKADFVANVSHDLKTPLSVIRMFGETLEMGRVTEDAQRRQYYHVITRESERLSRLIENVLDFSRIESGRRRYDLAPAAVEPLIRETLEAFSYPLAQHGFKVMVTVAPDLPEVPMDGDAIAQALGNLVDNAIKYAGERKAITIEAGVIDGHLALSVADEGIGIPEREQGRIFEKFYRVGRSETQGRRGSGVGLALVRHIALAHGGRVTVASAPGDGSRFTLWLPLHRTLPEVPPSD